MSSGYHRGGANVRPKYWDNTLSPYAERQITAPPAAAPEIHPTDVASPRLLGYTGNTCSFCSSTRMTIAGHCEVCADCGTSSGCS